jgi:hypothetical protein
VQTDNHLLALFGKQMSSFIAHNECVLSDTLAIVVVLIHNRRMLI